MTIDNRSLARVKNRKLFIQQLFNHEEISQIEISRQLGLNKSTISSIYSDLKKEGLITERGQGSSTSNGGRKPKMLQLNPNYGYVASFEIDTNHLHAMLTYLNGEVISYEKIFCSSDDILDIMNIIKNYLSRSFDTHDTLKGLLAIGFSIHGIVYQDQILDSPFLHFDGVNLKNYFEKVFKVPVILENEANLAAVFEHDFGYREPLKNSLTISIHRGIGAGIITNHHLYHGFEGNAGEIGRSLVTKSNGQTIKVEDVCSEAAILNEVSQRLDRPITRYDLRLLYEEKNPLVLEVIETALDQLKKVVFNSVVSFGPQALYFSAPLFTELPDLFRKLKRWLQKHHLEKIEIKMIQNSEYAPLMGASSRAIHTALEMDEYSLSMKWPKKIENID